MFGILSLLQPASAAEVMIATKRRSDRKAGGGYNPSFEKRPNASPQLSQPAHAIALDRRNYRSAHAKAARPRVESDDGKLMTHPQTPDRSLIIGQDAVA